MSNSQIVFDRLPSIPPNSFLRFNIIDNGDGTFSLYLEERANSEFISNAASILATGSTLAGGSSTTAQGLSKNSATVTIDSNGDIIVTPGPSAVQGLRIASGGAAADLVLDNGKAIRFIDAGGGRRAILSLTSGNNVQIQTPPASGSILNIIANASGAHQWLTNTSTERMRLTNGGILTFGGVTSSQPAIKPSGTGLQVRVADDSAFANLRALSFTFNDGTTQTTAAVAATPGGSDTQVQFNNGGAFGGDTGLVFNKTTDIITIGGGIILNAGQLVLPNGSAGAPSLIFSNDTDTGFLSTSGGIIDVSIQGTREIQFASQELRLITDTSKINFGAGLDVGLLRNAAAQIKITDGGAGTGSLLANNVRATTYNVGASAGVDGTFTTVDLKTVTVTKGIITSIV